MKEKDVQKVEHCHFYGSNLGGDQFLWQAAAADFAQPLGGVNSLRDCIQLENGAMGGIARKWPF